MEIQASVEIGRFAPFVALQGFRYPILSHDHGFLDDGMGGKDTSQMEAPTEADRDSLLKWEAMARAAQVLRPDLWDGVGAYLHFLHGKGADHRVDYEDYLEDDRAGQRTLQSAVEDVRFAAHELHRGLGGGDRNFLMQSDVIPAGASGDATNDRYPYPGTENWQKAIGAHKLWIEAEVSLRGHRQRVDRRGRRDRARDEAMSDLRPSGNGRRGPAPDRKAGILILALLASLSA